jgi:hypothetical protein
MAASAPYDQTGLSVNVQAPGTVDLEPTSYSPNPACGSPCNEGGSRSFTMWVRNNGTVTAPVTTVVMLFDGSPAPNPYGGLCNVGPIAPGATASCTNASPVNLTFPGGNVSVKADYNNQVAESNESNNVYTSGAMYVVPNAPSNARVCPGNCDLYGFKDNSDIETGFRVQIQRRQSCTSGSYTTITTQTKPAKSRTDDVYFYDFPQDGCWWRITVRANGHHSTHSSVVTSAAVQK